MSRIFLVQMRNKSNYSLANEIFQWLMELTTFSSQYVLIDVDLGPERCQELRCQIMMNSRLLHTESRLLLQ